MKDFLISKIGVFIHRKKQLFVSRVIELLSKIGLIPDIIKIDDLDDKTINWNERLSGREKQKIGIIRAILSNSKFIIMDESTSAIDGESKKIVYELIKGYLHKPYTIIYTDHDTTGDFADKIISIVGENLEIID